MNKEKTLILMGTNKENIFEKDWLENGYLCSDIFKSVSKPLRLIRRFCMKNNGPLYKCWLGEWFDQLDDYEVVIIHMSRLTNVLPEVIAKKNPNIRIICWYWNTVDIKTVPIDFHNRNIEYWSFDQGDCEKYNMKKNIQYYCTPDLNNIEKDIDIYFVGRDKGRKEQIIEFKKKMETLGIKCLFRVIENDSDLLPYSEVKKELVRSKCVLEINKDNQIGYTLRVLESLFYKIKLITNNKSIIEADFYNKNNIFVFGEDDEAKLYDFVNSDYDESSDKYKTKYDLNAWFNNFSK